MTELKNAIENFNKRLNQAEELALIKLIVND